MERENGHFDVMDARLHFGSLRPKSKVPRALGPQRPDYVDCSLRKDYSPRDCGPLQGGMSTTLHQLGDTDENKEWQRLVGERVCISGVKQGILRYFGRTNFAQGYWCGVELDEPVGKNNGTVSGVVYFNCKPNHGIFAPVSKVSKLNDLSTCNWQQQDMSSQQHRHSGWDYNLGLLADSSEKKFIRNSISDPTFLQAAPARASMPRCSESFPYDKRSFTEQRDSATLNAVRNFGKTSSGSSSVNVIKNSSSSRSLSKYGYGKKNQYFSSNVITLGDHGGASETMHSTMRSGSGSTHNSSLTSALEEYEQFLRTPTNSGQGSPLSSEGAAKRFNELPFYDYGKMPDAFLGAFQSHDFSDFEDEVDNDDHMSVDYDESLGILTPSQMKDLTLGPDFPTSLSDIRGLDFPSSESFDDINDLPEDEQVHDVSVIHLSESSTTRNVEVSKQNNSGNYSKNSEDKGHVSSTGKFLFSIAQKDRENSPVDSRFTSTAVEEFRFNSAEGFERTYKINNLSSANVLCSDKSNNVKKDVSEKYYGTKTFSKEESLNLSLHQSSSALSSGSPLTREQNTTEVNQKTSSYHIQSDSSGSKEMICNEDVSRKSSDIDNSRDSFLQAESESNTTLKEKLTVSWEDCLSRNSDCMFPHVERPESVYTVGSNDTGFQEDGEMEGDAVMTTSIDSTDGNKRFSTTSRDSCIVSDEVDVYKIAESNSTSGYSTGLSDSCCNDRAEDDPSSKPLTDEEIQDSVGHCDSEDAFSFHENSLSKDADMMNMETSEVTTENVTALCNNDSASDALCETMVEDSTLTEIHDLLLSPEDNISPLETKEILVDSPKDGIKTIEESTNSPAQSTPEKKQNTKPKTSASRNTSSSGASRVSRTSRVCDDDQDRKKQVVKSPKKNVMSKIKAMIEATSCKTVGRSKPESSEPVNRRAVSAPKKSRWEAVTSKIAASLAEEKIKPKAKREIRSRVDTNLTLARQQICKSPKLDSCRLSNCGDGSMSPASVCSRDRRPLTEKNSAPSSVREGRVNASRDSKQRPRSPRPGKACSRSASPVAPSESSTNSISLNSKSKIAHWEGSTSTIASSVPPPAATVTKRPPPVAKAPSTIRTTPARSLTKKPTPTVPKIRISSSVRSQSPAPSSRTDRNHQLHPRKTKEQTGGRGTHLTTKPVRPPMWLSKAELTQEIQRLGNLCEARTKELNRLKMETKHVSVGFDAFAALFKYMAEDLNALSIPMLSEDLEKTLKQLELAKQDLAYYEKEVEEMKAHHCQELNDLSNKLFEVFQGEVTELSAKHQEEMNRLKHDHLKQIENLSSTYDTSSEEALAQHEILVSRLHQELITQRDELQMLHEKEILDLEQKHNQSTKTLQEHIEQLQKKCAELKHHSMGMEDAMRKDTDTKLQWVTLRKVDLEKEVESLKAVLEMKNKELHTLRVQNLEMEKQLEELPLARERIKMLQARAEDLEALMIEKTKLERKLSTENHQIKDTYEKESKVNKRLSMENEELQWRLRQAEHSLISGSFSEVLEYPEDVENGSISPLKSPAQMSRSVFFTFVDKEDNISTPRSQYKKITPGFSAGYKTSPAKSSRSPPVPSPRRAKSNSEPPQPPALSSTPRRSSKQTSLKQKRQRSGSDSGKPTGEQSNVGFLSFAGSMASSVSSECSVFEQRESLLEDHKEQILESLEILREQRSSEENGGEPTTPNNVEEKWNSDSSKFNNESVPFENGDMSRSSEFSDPKTYYHMTFPVLKEAGVPDCDTEDISKVAHPDGTVAQPIHSMAESSDGSKVDRATIVEVGSKATFISLPEEVALAQVVGVVGVQQRALVQSCGSTDNIQDSKCNGQSIEQDRWRTI